MKELLLILGCILVCYITEIVYYRYLKTLPKEKQDELIKKQSEMRCRHCLCTDFEVVGMRYGKLQFQCKHCKRIR